MIFNDIIESKFLYPVLDFSQLQNLISVQD